MANSTSIIDYMGEGVFASRPVSPPVAATALAFYYATDTLALYLWNGTAWVSVGGGSALTIKSNGTTLTSAATSINFTTNLTTTNTGGAVTVSASGGGGGTLPTIRGSGIQASSASSYTVSWPVGTIAGDLVVIFVGGGYSISATPTGWTLLDSQIGTNWEGSTFGKVMSSGDITAGSVTVSMAGTFDSVLAVIAFVGATAGLYGMTSLQQPSGTSQVGLSGAANPTGAMGVYFGSNRAASADTISQGTSLQTANDGSSASGALYAGAPTGPFLATTKFNYSVVGTGNYQIQLFVAGP